MPQLVTLDGEVVTPAGAQSTGGLIAAGTTADPAHLLPALVQHSSAVPGSNMQEGSGQAPDLVPSAATTCPPSSAAEVAVLRAQLQAVSHQQASTEQLAAQQQALLQAELSQAHNLITQLQVG
jgi:hypothetical protein